MCICKSSIRLCFRRPTAGHVPTPAHPPTYKCHMVAFKTPRLSSSAEKQLNCCLIYRKHRNYHSKSGDALIQGGGGGGDSSSGGDRNGGAAALRGLVGGALVNSLGGCPVSIEKRTALVN